MADPGVTAKERTWREQCVRLVQARVPEVSREDAEKCAEDMARAWPALRPEDAVARYFEDPRFGQTDWTFFAIR
ncbi:MAG TPA: hypothetical protein VFZ93_10745 [Albitalea sp.]